MPPFKAPLPPHCKKHLYEWHESVPPEMQSSDLLLGDYWERFNTIRIPILGQYRYLDKAVKIAKLSKNKADFERMFREKNMQLEKEILQLMRKTANQTIYNNVFPCQDASNKAFAASTSGAFMDFVHILTGIAFGWEADAADEAQSDDSFNRQSSSCNKCGSTQLLSCTTCKWNMDTCDNCGPQLDRCNHCLTQVCDMHFRYQTPERNQPELEQSATAVDLLDSVTHERCITPASDDTAVIPQSELSAYREGFGGQSVEHVSGQRARFSDGPTISNQCTSRKRPRCPDDGDDDGRPHKRQNIKSPSIMRPTRISDQCTSRKRPRCHDDSDDDGRPHKRQRLESPSMLEPAPVEEQRPDMSAAYTSSSRASSSLQQVSSNKVVKKKSNPKNGNNHRRSSEKKRKSPHPPKTPHSLRSVTTRSLRKKGKFELWELDQSGKRRQLSGTRTGTI
ncbi:hypothetical protein J3F83DRAFT_731892 [Trichoderma novae-zelandiae]